MDTVLKERICPVEYSPAERLTIDHFMDLIRYNRDTLIDISTHSQWECDLFVWPEYVITGANLLISDLATVTVEVLQDGSGTIITPPVFEPIADMARSLQKVVVFVFLEKAADATAKEGWIYYNTMFTMDATGTILHTYRKQHLFFEVGVSPSSAPTECVDTVLHTPTGPTPVSLVPLICFDTQYMAFPRLSCRYPTVLTVSAWWTNFPPVVTSLGWGAGLSRAIHQNRLEHGTLDALPPITTVFNNANSFYAGPVTGSGVWADNGEPIRTFSGVLPLGTGVVAPPVGSYHPSALAPALLNTYEFPPATQTIRITKPGSYQLSLRSEPETVCMVKVARFSGDAYIAYYHGIYRGILPIRFCGVTSGVGSTTVLSAASVTMEADDGPTYPMSYPASLPWVGPTPHVVHHKAGQKHIIASRTNGGLVLWQRDLSSTERVEAPVPALEGWVGMVDMIKATELRGRRFVKRDPAPPGMSAGDVEVVKVG